MKQLHTAKKSLSLKTLITLACCMGLSSQAAFSAPQGGTQIDGGNTVNISSSGSLTTVDTGGASRPVVQWDSFDVDAAEMVNFAGMSSSDAILNIIEGDQASQIDGRINSHGQVFLVNPNGIIFGKDSIVNVGSLVASTLTIDTDDFEDDDNDGSLNLTTEGSTRGAIINNGNLLATSGSIGLIGHTVINRGHISARLGNVALKGGEAMTLDFDGNGLMQFKVTQELSKNFSNATAAVSNTGTLLGRNVVLEARVAASIFTNSVNHAGFIEASKIVASDGSIELIGSIGSPNTISTAAVSRGTISNTLQPSLSGQSPAPAPSPTPASSPAPTDTAQTLNANAQQPELEMILASSSSSSLGLFNVEGSGIKLPADQLEE